MTTLRKLPLLVGLALFLIGPNAVAADADGTTPLHWASYRDDLDSAEALIRGGADVNAANDLGATPLWTACLNGSAAMVEILLKAGADPNRALLAGETPVMIAARTGNPDVVKQLLDKEANVNAKGPRGQTPLMWAVAQKHSAIVKILLARGADVHARSEGWSQVMAVPPHGFPGYNRAIPHGKDTALLFASRGGDLASAKLLVSAGANVNDADAWGVTATVLAAHSGFGEIVEFLLDKGADPNLAAAGFTALHEAIMRRDEKVAAALLAHGANPNTPLGTWTPIRRSSKDLYFDPILVGATPFWLAARFSQPGVMRMLLKHGADPLFVHQSESGAGRGFELRKDSTNALMAAVGMGGGTAWVQPPRGEREALTLEAVNLAVECGVDLNATSGGGRTALSAAKGMKYESVIKFLVEKGAK